MAAIGTRTLKMTVGAVEMNAQVSDVRISVEDSDSDFTSFADAAAGGSKQYILNFTAVQDPDTGTLWDQVFTNAGTSVACVLMPYGNAVASAAQPHFTFNAIIAAPDGDFLGGEANSSTSAKFTFSSAWNLVAKPVKKITA